MREKLNNRRGVTIVFAVTVFLVVTLFCVSIISAGLAGAGSAHAAQSSEQAYLAVSSAARLVQEDVKGGSVTKTVEYSTDGTAQEPAYGCSRDTAVLAALRDLVGDGAEKTLTVTAQPFADVTVTLTRDASYNVTAKFVCDGGALTVTFRAAAATVPEYGTYEKTVDGETVNVSYKAKETTTVTWTVAEVE